MSIIITRTRTGGLASWPRSSRPSPARGGTPRSVFGVGLVYSVCWWSVDLSASSISWSIRPPPPPAQSHIQDKPQQTHLQVFHRVPRARGVAVDREGVLPPARAVRVDPFDVSPVSQSNSAIHAHPNPRRTAGSTAWRCGPRGAARCGASGPPPAHPPVHLYGTYQTNP